MQRARAAGPWLAALVACFTGPAYADLIGTSVTSQYYYLGGVYSGLGSPASFVADGTVQESFCTPCGLAFNLSITDTQIEYALAGTLGPWNSSPVSLDTDGLYIANGNLLTFSGVTITGVTLDASSNVAGFTGSNITFNAQNIAIDWAGLGAPGEQVILDVTSSSLPEPAPWAMLLAGLAGIGVWHRLRGRVARHFGHARPSG